MKIIHNILLAGTFLASLGNAFAAEETSLYTKPTGTYVGTYKLVMNTSDPLKSVFASNLPLKYSNEDVEYVTLGYSVNNGLWKWDFDNMKVTWGGSQLFALEAIRIKFQIYNQNMADEKTGTYCDENYQNCVQVKETYPHISSTDEITMDIVDNEDGTYLVDFGKKIYLSLQGYPFGNTTGKFKISLEDEQLKIESLDYETDGEALDGIPGTRISDVFPLIVQPSYYSVKMEKDDGTDTNEDGITDIEAQFLGLDKNVADTDGDGVNDIDEMKTVYTPEDTDEDGIPDYLEPGTEAEKGYLLSKLTSEIGPSFSIENNSSISVDGLSLLFEHYDTTLRNRATIIIMKGTGDIPPKINDEGTEIYYKTLNIGLSSYTATAEDNTYTITFEDEIPENFEAYLGYADYSMSDDIDSETGLTISYYTYSKINWEKLSNNQISLDSFDTEGNVGKLIFAMGEKRKIYLESKMAGIKYLNSDIIKSSDLKFTNPGYEGETDVDGSFYYGSGEVALSIGNVSLGKLSSVNEDGKILIQDIVGTKRIDVENANVLKMAQFLYSLDSNSDTQTVDILESTIESLSQLDEVELLSDNFNASEVLSQIGIEVKTEAEVIEKLRNNLYDEDIAKKVYLIDSYVSGISIVNDGITSKTYEDGSFDYAGGEVSFSVGNVNIGSISTINEDGKIFIQDIVGVNRDNLDDETVLKIAQFLQSLDSDPSTEEIEISDTSIVALSGTGTRNIQSSDFDVEEVLTAASIDVKAMDEVKTHLKDTLVANGIIAEETEGGNGGSGGSFSWLMLLGLLGLMFKTRR